MTSTITETISLTFEINRCASCDVHFGMTERFIAARRKDHKTFYCPNGHSLAYSAEMTERRRRAAKGQLTKTLNRIKAGMCVICNQQFPDVERHMAEEHPYEPTATLDDVEAGS